LFKGEHNKRYSQAGGDLDEAVVENLLRDRVEFFEKQFEIPVNQIDYSPLQIVAKTPLSKAYFIFSMLSPGAVYVTEGGVLTGVLTKDILIRHAANTAI
jgi:hypothetical protein